MYEVIDEQQDQQRNRNNCDRTNEAIASYMALFAQFLGRLKRIIRDSSLAEDVAQEALLAAWRECPFLWWQEDATAQLHAWLRVVARRLAITWARRCKRHPEVSLDALPVEPRDRRGEESASVERHEEECARLRASVEELRETEPDSYRLMHGHYFENRSVAEIAEEIGISANTASQRLKRLRDRLRVWLLQFREDEHELRSLWPMRAKKIRK